jgi:hypothetical protein
MIFLLRELAERRVKATQSTLFGRIERQHWKRNGYCCKSRRIIAESARAV